MFNEFAKTVLVIVAGLFPIINPPAVALVVLSMLPHISDAERQELARRISLNSFVILLVSLSVGAYVLNFFGISIPVLRVAGGIVVSMAGWSLLQAPDEDASAEPTPKPRSGASLRAKAFYPLTLPITVGPGSIAVAIALGTGSPRHGLQPVHIVGVTIGLVLVCASIYVCVRFAGYLERLLGTVGTQVAMRLFAFVIFCIGVQILWLGLSELLGSIHPVVK
ncbi:MarC family protein [Caballeronia sp. LZ062]|uniref:MarC family protein n=1 Tax=unclassified Caballeronia TaxID=2646786 RepID=UPI002854E279|nr:MULTISPECIES: MarC family protein [unclassified Caballeronia]MDR5856286.1 MarC family protein [Caballeronia sp. LZ050]MDR5872957.1 MarC family protein [Caballeronia sp. LZ062]